MVVAICIAIATLCGLFETVFDSVIAECAELVFQDCPEYV